jgi:hypothetical protein
MELTYLVRGADGKQYGPATSDQLVSWIREGRLQAQAQVQRSDMSHWASAQDFLELQPAFNIPVAAEAVAAPSSPTGVSPQRPAGQTDPGAVARMRSGGSWFYWIAGLSLINSIAAFSGGSWRFILGLGITQLLDAFGREMGGGGKTIVLLLDLITAGLFVGLGIFSHKGHAWAFVVGMVLFALDGVFFLLIQDWLGVGFHALVLYWLFRGFTACRELRR